MTPRAPRLWIYLVVGILFGIVITKAEVISWFRIQEMFRFEGFHMFGIFATAVPVAILTVQAMKRLGARTVEGERVVVPPKDMKTGTRYWLGGTIFGVGWSLTGACPGPMFALLGSGIGVVWVILVSAMVGTWTYGLLRPRLPH
jgi:uncharacterized membrane protein YedE/YeeE